MDDQQIIVQYPIAGFGDADALSKRYQIEDLLGQALASADIGHCDGGDIGSGSMNIFLYTHDRRSAEQLIIRTLKVQKLLESAVIAVCFDLEADEPYEVIWPLDFEGKFRVL